MGSRTRGTGPLRRGRFRGLFLSVVPGSPVIVLWEMLPGVRSSSQTVPSGPVWTYTHSHPLRSQKVLTGFRKFHSLVRERLLGVEELSFGPQRSQEEPGCSAIAWVEISLVWVEVWVENRSI